MESETKVNQKEHGQSMVELAITITVLMILLAGTIDFGRAFFTWMAMRDAAQEGASYASINPTSANVTCLSASSEQICKRIWDNLRQVINDPGASVSAVIQSSGPQCLGVNPGTITVVIDYDNFNLTMPFIGTILGSQTIPIHATINDTIIAPKCP
jgi:hypothetical protein